MLIEPDGRDFATLKRLKRGSARLDRIYAEFSMAFADQFGFEPLAVGVDSLASPGDGGIRPRLSVVLERTAQRVFFHRPQQLLSNYDRRKQRLVAELFAANVREVDLRRLFGLPRTTPEDFPWVDQLLVTFEDFESAAIEEIHGLVAAADLDAWVATLGLGDQFWCARRLAGPPIVFVQTEAQAAILRADGRLEEWSASYFAVARQHDEFGYLTPDDARIAVDSKENLDTTYAGSWFNYFR